MAFLVCGDFCGESGVLKLSVCGIHPLTQRYVPIHHPTIDNIVALI
ncbi:DUF3265 domain-containing protein [Vibrio cholerae]|nr:DUF3265 domain-containing protein [Vibrio cholerae]EKF9480207.1 DUF3265 domain-containing protein [Vibrio cholerae]